MKNATFIDTGAFIALMDKNDRHHAQACTLAAEIEKIGARVTSTFVLLEAGIYLQRRSSVSASQRFWRSMISGEAQVDLLTTETKDLQRALEISTQYADQSFSWVDCTSFALMERHKITHAFAFDRDFLIFQPAHGMIRRIPMDIQETR